MDSKKQKNIVELLEVLMRGRFADYRRLPDEIHLGVKAWNVLVKHLRDTSGVDFSPKDNFKYKDIDVVKRMYAPPFSISFIFKQKHLEDLED